MIHSNKKWKWWSFWRFQNLRVSGKYVKCLPKMFQGCQKAKGFRVSRDRRLTLASWGFQVVWRFQNPRVSGKIYKIYKIWAWPKISSYVHSEVQLRPHHLWTSGPERKRTPRCEDIFKYGNNCSIIRSYYTSDYWQPGALVSFFNYIPGLLFPKKIM